MWQALETVMVSPPVGWKYQRQQEKIKKVREIFEESPFNTYQGPENPDLDASKERRNSQAARVATTKIDGEKRMILLFEELTSFRESKRIAPYKLPERIKVLDALTPSGDQTVGEEKFEKEVICKIKSSGKLSLGGPV